MPRGKRVGGDMDGTVSTLIISGVMCALGSVIGYIAGQYGSDEDDLRRADAFEDSHSSGYADGFRDGQAASDSLYGGDWDRGYNTGLEVGRGSSIVDPETLTTTATAVRDARLHWMHSQTKNYMTTYRALLWRCLEVARDIGERYRQVESLGQSGLIPIGDALNVCVYVADVAKQYDDNKILTRPHAGIFEGKPS